MLNRDSTVCKVKQIITLIILILIYIIPTYINGNSCVLCIKRQNFKVWLVVSGIVVKITELRLPVVVASGGSRNNQKVLNLYRYIKKYILIL